MLSAKECYSIFQKSVDDYHVFDDVNASPKKPFSSSSFQSLLYLKNWIDTVQWHLEDLIRDPGIDPTAGIKVKRRIDKSNQERTDIVEKIDDFFLDAFKHVQHKPEARLNSESPAWLLDRMSILMLKIYHMHEQTIRHGVSAEHLGKCRDKLLVLEEQKKDMERAFDELIEDIETGVRTFKVYRQMKMYNDATLNPVLYNPPASGQ
jgi:ribosome-associated translation inhibitor RaiA